MKCVFPTGNAIGTFELRGWQRSEKEEEVQSTARQSETFENVPKVDKFFESILIGRWYSWTYNFIDIVSN